MKRKCTLIVAMALAVVMLVSFTLIGCKAAATETTAAAATQTTAAAAETTAAPETTAPVEARVLEVAHNETSEHFGHAMLLEMSDALEKATNGRLKFKVYPNGSYASQVNMQAAVKMGALDIYMGGILPDDYAPIGAIQMPFLFRDYAHWDTFVASDLCKELLTASGKASGLITLGMHTYGFRYVHTRDKETKTVEDFKGFKLRIVNFAPYKEVATILGATGVPIPVAELYMALKTGVVDGAENPLIQILDLKFYEPDKYLILTKHMMAPRSFQISMKCWNSLSVEDQAIIEGLANEYASKFGNEVKTQEEANIAKLVELGMTTVEPDMESFKTRIPLVLENQPAWAGVIDKIAAIQ